MEQPGASFDWSVDTGGYRWSEDFLPALTAADQTRRPRGMRGAVEGPWLVPQRPLDADHPGRVYQPLRRNRRDLHLEFAQLPFGDDDAALEAMARFASRYGQLGAEQVQLVTRQYGGGRSFFGENLLTWRRAIADVKMLAELSKACKDPDIKLLRKLVKVKSDPWRVTLRWQSAGHTIVNERTAEANEAAALRSWVAATSDTGRFVAPVRHFLVRELNARLKAHIAPQVAREEIVFLPDSLLGALYLLTAEQFVGLSPTKTCPACGRWFIPRSRSSQRTCSDACRLRLSRMRRQEKQA
jgi:predicted nucleic acid-binding Zn ribbon protein